MQAWDANVLYIYMYEAFVLPTSGTNIGQNILMSDKCPSAKG